MLSPRSILRVLPFLLVAACGNSSSSGGSDEAPPADEGALHGSSTGAPSIVIPMIDESKKLLSRFNDQARAKHLNEIPDTVEVKTRADGDKVANLRNYFDEKIMPAVGARKQAMPSWGPDSFANFSKRNRLPTLCYKGDPHKIADFIGSLADNVFSDQLQVQGWKYKQETHYAEGNEEFGDDFPDLWKQWRGTGESILLVTSIGDGGDDLSPAIVPPCKP